jgi:hypothetical protein
MKWLELALSMLMTLIAVSELCPRISMMGKGIKLPQCYLDGSGVASMAACPILMVFRLGGADAPSSGCDSIRCHQWSWGNGLALFDWSGRDSIFLAITNQLFA